MAACIGLFMMIVFTSAVRRMLHEDKINDKLLDLELVTVDDYTTQTHLNPKIYEEFKHAQLALKQRLEHVGTDQGFVLIMKFKKIMMEKISE